MVTTETVEQEAATSSSFERYAARTLPEALRPEAGQPPTWAGSAEGWAAARAAAEVSHRQQCQLRFAHMIAVEGWTPGEVGSGQLESGAEVRAADGFVIRPRTTNLAPEVLREALELRRELSVLQIHFEPILASDLDGIAYGRPCDEGRAETILRAAREAIQTKMATLRSDAAKPKIVLRCYRSFRAMGRPFFKGEAEISNETKFLLETWAERMVAQAQQRKWPAPLNYTPESWPPFVIEKG